MPERVKVRVKKKKNKRKIILKRILLLFFLFSIVFAGIIGYKVYKTLQAADSSYKELDRGEKSKLRKEVVDLKKKQPFSVLLLGVEDYATGGKGGRTDSIIVATINPKQKTMKLLSIPRDTRVEISGDTSGTKTRINSAYGKGGAQTTVETVEKLLNIPIDYYATVDFKGFKKTIDEVGGVDVEVPFDFNEKSDTSKSKKFYFQKGNMHLNGEEALAYARMRKQDPRGDFGRNDRQKQILMAMLDQVSKPSNLAKIDTLADQVSDNITTNLRITQVLALQQIFSGFKGNDVETLTLKGSDLYIGNKYFFQPDDEELTKVQKELYNFLYPDK
ncbi:LCP family protein [Bacillus subtilis]|uniref:LCP family protein n=1 Tax=Bacillus TaxID=1386 RepID=UPI001E574182|nr:LCP family protein [Bacillus subtilis]MED4515060.1 LCP family protein [Bacillus subtilis]